MEIIKRIHIKCNGLVRTKCVRNTELFLCGFHNDAINMREHYNEMFIKIIKGWDKSADFPVTNATTGIVAERIANHRILSYL